MSALYLRIEKELLNKLNESGNNGIKIATIQFAFDNTELMKLLMKRGSLITAGRYDKLCIVDSKIDQLMKAKHSRPVSSFITFETQEGYHQALDLFQKQSFMSTKNKNF